MFGARSGESPAPFSLRSPPRRNRFRLPLATRRACTSDPHRFSVHPALPLPSINPREVVWSVGPVMSLDLSTASITKVLELKKRLESHRKLELFGKSPLHQGREQKNGRCRPRAEETRDREPGASVAGPGVTTSATPGHEWGPTSRRSTLHPHASRTLDSPGILRNGSRGACRDPRGRRRTSRPGPSYRLRPLACYLTMLPTGGRIPFFHDWHATLGRRNSLRRMTLARRPQSMSKALNAPGDLISFTSVLSRRASLPTRRRSGLLLASSAGSILSLSGGADRSVRQLGEVAEWSKAPVC